MRTHFLEDPKSLAVEVAKVEKGVFAAIQMAFRVQVEFPEACVDTLASTIDKAVNCATKNLPTGLQGTAYAVKRILVLNDQHRLRSFSRP